MERVAREPEMSEYVAGKVAKLSSQEFMSQIRLTGYRYEGRHIVGVYQVPSEKQGHDPYETTLCPATGKTTCTCQSRVFCKHEGLLKKRLAMYGERIWQMGGMTCHH